jgi:hypothetical protein
MEVRDGFIGSIYNYCDRWCEACALTSRCRLFADIAKAEAALDPHLKAVVEAPPLPHEVPPPPPKWVQELIEEMNEAACEALVKDQTEVAASSPEHESVEARALAYCDKTHAWLRSRDASSLDDPADPLSVIAWFHTLVPAKIHRALNGLAGDVPEERDWPADHDGSAKVALLGIERSHVAWLQIVEGGAASAAEIETFLADLVWLGEAVERVFPHARAFVRPAFDEPEELARLLVEENDLSGRIDGL